MHARLSLAAIAAFGVAGCTLLDAPSLHTPAPERVDNAVIAARSAADTLQRELTAALAEAMASSGPGGAMGVCNTKALQITTRVSANAALNIRRTALRLRNPANAPDAWEKEQLASFASALSSGRPPAGLERYKVEQVDGAWRLRWTRPIVLQPMCATCHGKDINSGVREILTALYPADQATGFEIGELRGAFTASVPILFD